MTDAQHVEPPRSSALPPRLTIWWRQCRSPSIRNSIMPN